MANRARSSAVEQRAAFRERQRFDDLLAGVENVDPREQRARIGIVPVRVTDEVGGMLAHEDVTIVVGEVADDIRPAVARLGFRQPCVAAVFLQAGTEAVDHLPPRSVPIDGVDLARPARIHATRLTLYERVDHTRRGRPLELRDGAAVARAQAEHALEGLQRIERDVAFVLEKRGHREVRAVRRDLQVAEVLVAGEVFDGKPVLRMQARERRDRRAQYQQLIAHWKLLRSPARCSRGGL
jgi:hypothetical protein